MHQNPDADMRDLLGEGSCPPVDVMMGGDAPSKAGAPSGGTQGGSAPFAEFTI